MQGSAADPASFYKPYHIPKYTYNTSRVFRLSDSTLKTGAKKGSVISASVSFKMNFSEDSWVVALARGTRKTDGYRSLFPVVTNVLVKSGKEPEEFDPADLSLLSCRQEGRRRSGGDLATRSMLMSMAMVFRRSGRDIRRFEKSVTVYHSLLTLFPPAWENF